MVLGLAFLHLARHCRRPGALRVYLACAATLDTHHFRPLPEVVIENASFSADNLRLWIRELIELGVLEAGPLSPGQPKTYRLVAGDPRR